MRLAKFLLAPVTRLTALALVLGAGPAPAQGEREPGAAGEPIMRQLEAFRSDDYDTAYTFASESIRQMFDRQAFEQMVKGGYPEIARSSFAQVAESRLGADGHVYLRVRIHGANGNSVEAVYDMVWEGGAFRINGVVAKPDPGLV